MTGSEKAELQPLSYDMSALELVSRAQVLDLVYPSPDTTTMSGVPVINNGLVNTQTANSLNLGSTISFNINNMALLNMVYLNLTLNALVGNTMSLPRAWGFRAIRSIQIRIGSSSLYEFSGYDNWLAFCSQAETREKLDRMADCAGDSRGFGNYWTSNTAVIPLCILPWCNLHRDTLPMDSSLINTPIQVTVNLQDASRFQLVRNANDGNALNNAALVNTYSNVFFTVEQQLFKNQADSLKYDLLNDPMRILPYPFLFYNSTNVINYVPSKTNLVPVNLLSFRKGSLVGIILAPRFRNAVPAGAGVSYNAAVTTVYDVFNNNFYNPITKLTLSSNGQLLHRFESEKALISYLCRNQTTNPGFNLGNLKWNNGNTRYQENGENLEDTLYYLPLSQHIVTDVSHHMEQGLNISNQVLQLEIQNQFDPTDAANMTVDLNVTYVYNSSIFFQNGLCDIVF